MSFNYAKLQGRIIEVFSSQGAFAGKMGLSERTISQKLNGHKMFKQGEIVKAVEILGLECSDIPEYFFTPKVQSI